MEPLRPLFLALMLLPAIAGAEEAATCPADTGSGAVAAVAAPVDAAKDKSCAGADRKLPDALTAHLDALGPREDHYLWHLVRLEWPNLPPAAQQKLAAAGWTPPRQQNQPGAGKDFVCMHHQMILDANRVLAQAGDPCYREVKGFDPIPFDRHDPAWPAPDGPFRDNDSTQSDAKTWKGEYDSKYSQDSWLQSEASLDDLGAELERGIHTWMHYRFADNTGPKDALACIGTNADGCDWLPPPFLNLVNPAFWKIHGWIEERAAKWAALHGTTLDTACQGAFVGPPSTSEAAERGASSMAGMDMSGGSMSRADFEALLKLLPPGDQPGIFLAPQPYGASLE